MVVITIRRFQYLDGRWWCEARNYLWCHRRVRLQSDREPTEIHDLHATMLHLLGVDHTRSTFRFGGRDMRLTDVKGHVIHDVIA